MSDTTETKSAAKCPSTNRAIVRKVTIHYVTFVDEPQYFVRDDLEDYGYRRTGPYSKTWKLREETNELENAMLVYPARLREQKEEFRTRNPDKEEPSADE